MSEKTPYTAAIDSDAERSPRRIAFLTKNTSAKVVGERPSQLMSYPHIVLREMIVLMGLIIALAVLALFWDAPLEQLANPLLTPNPAKAPWYFLGLQELLHYFPPIVAGVILPGLVVVALVVIPYFEINAKNEPFWSGNSARRFFFLSITLAVLTIVLLVFEAWTVLAPTVVLGLALILVRFRAEGKSAFQDYLRSRPISWWVMTWFITVSVILTVVGTYFRGPGWSWVWPWR